jgi:hypothetical protein
MELVAVAPMGSWVPRTTVDSPLEEVEDSPGLAQATR